MGTLSFVRNRPSTLGVISISIQGVTVVGQVFQTTSVEDSGAAGIQLTALVIGVFIPKIMHRSVKIPCLNALFV